MPAPTGFTAWGRRDWYVHRTTPIWLAYVRSGIPRYFRVVNASHVTDESMAQIEGIFEARHTRLPTGWIPLGQIRPNTNEIEPPLEYDIAVPAALADDATTDLPMPRQPLTNQPNALQQAAATPLFTRIDPPDFRLIDPLAIDGATDLPVPDAEFMASVRDLGITTPIIVRRLDNGRYELFAGRRRLAAWLTFDSSREIPAMVYATGSDRNTLRLIAIAENNQRAPNVMADYHHMLDLIASGTGVDNARVAAAARLPEPLVEQRMRLGALSAELAPHVASGRIAPQIALRIARLPVERQRILVRTLGERLASEQAARNTGHTAERAMITSRDLGPSSADQALVDIADQIERLPRTAYPARDQVARLSRLVGCTLVDNVEYGTLRTNATRQTDAVRRVAILEASVRDLEAQLQAARAGAITFTTGTVRDALNPPIPPAGRPDRSRDSALANDDPEERGVPLPVVDDAVPDVNVEDGNESWATTLAHLRAAQRTLPPAPDTTHDNAFRAVTQARTEVERVIANATIVAEAVVPTPEPAPRPRSTGTASTRSRRSPTHAQRAFEAARAPAATGNPPTVTLEEALRRQGTTPEQVAERIVRAARTGGVVMPETPASHAPPPVSDANASRVRGTGVSRDPMAAARARGGIAGLSEAERLLADMADQVRSNDTPPRRG